MATTSQKVPIGTLPPTTDKAGTLGQASASTASQLAGPRRKLPSVIEMLEYVKGLDLDPVKEFDMLWIAEEAFNAPLPPGWTEHEDERGRLYFHNSFSGVSSWSHPSDPLFRDLVNYHRRVVANGGFWYVEDEISQKEEEIRLRLADWMELFDQHGEKFFFNRATEESRCDDPRMAEYHDLYARIKMVAKMKQRMPVLARAPRPEEPTAREIEFKRRKEEELQRMAGKVVCIQAAVRAMIARRRVRILRAQATCLKGPQPLRGRLRLQMEKVGPGMGKELVISQTTPHKRHRAAVKLQARIRSFLARKHLRPLLAHRAYLSKLITKVQKRARVWLSIRRVGRLRYQLAADAAVAIQRTWRGYVDRLYVSSLRSQKERFDQVIASVVKAQSAVRLLLAKRRVARIRAAPRVPRIEDLLRHEESLRKDEMKREE